MNTMNGKTKIKRTTTINVSDVPLATAPLPEVPYPKSVNRLLGQPSYNKEQQIKMVQMEIERLSEEPKMPDRIDELLAESKQKLAITSASETTTTDNLVKDSLQKKKQVFLKQIDIYEKILFDRDKNGIRGNDWRKQSLMQELANIEATEFPKFTPIEASSCDQGNLLALGQEHPVMCALYMAFSDHRPLCLSPDMIWLLICQGIAQHVNVEPERLRKKFVQHDGKVKIEVVRNEFIKGSLENRWDGVIDELCLRVREHIGSAHDQFVPNFSTTGTKERIAAEIVFLDAVKSYFTYEVHSLCGIPSIELEGTVEDWQLLADRVEAFAEFNLEWWLTALRPILKEFIAAVRGEVRQDFWESIYKFESVSGGGAITGWFAAFFPYFKDKNGFAAKKNPWIGQGGKALSRLIKGQWGDSKMNLYGPSLADFPSSLTRVPFVWNHFQKRFDMELLGGFVGVAQDEKTLALRPEIGWAIRESVPTESAPSRLANGRPELR
jgi:hypothetical protein